MLGIMSEVKSKQKRRIRKGGKWVEVECEVVVISGAEWLKCVDDGNIIYYRT